MMKHYHQHQQFTNVTVLSLGRWESKDLSIWRAHSYLIFERKVHRISFSGYHTGTVRLHSAKGFLGLIPNKSLKPCCPSVTNLERKARVSTQLPNQCTEQNLTAIAGGKQLHRLLHVGKLAKALLSLIRKNQKNISHAKRAEGPEEGPGLISQNVKMVAF